MYIPDRRVDCITFCQCEEGSCCSRIGKSNSLGKYLNKNSQEISLIHRPVIRSILRRLIHIAFSVISDFRVIGKENIPAEGPLLVVGNHFNFVDPLAFIEMIPRTVEFLGGTEMPGAPRIVHWIPKMWGVYQVHRGSVSREALTKAEMILARGGVLGIFPEAGSWAEVLRPARPGAALLAVRSNAMILPVGLDGLPEILPLRLGKRPKVTIRVGQPFGPIREDIRGRDGRRKLDEIGDLIMHKISELIPPERRGCYSDDPQLRAAAIAVAKYPWEGVMEK
ncbi:MAG: 1-acyl-sn-glycerol-3-phosphate acyltransferase [Anaerolineaceae bacterium]|nr:1-acyl-sn-glycerol-3-phosphate acyltransferase [Anaerolineaceae bacterium]